MRYVLSLCLVLCWAVSASAQTHLAVIVVDFPTSEPAPAATMDWVRSTVTEVESFYAEQSYGQFSLDADVFGIYTVPADATTNRTQLATLARAAAAADGVALASYTKWLYISPTTNYVRAGYGDNLGAWIALLSQYPAAPQFQIIAHELGHHVFGLNHAHGRICSDGPQAGPCTLVEYGDSLDVMGQGGGHFGAIVKQQLGWLTPTLATHDGDYVLTPYEVSGSALRVSGTGKNSWRSYTFEYRQPIGFDAVQPWADPAYVFPGVIVHWAFNTTELLQMHPQSGTQGPFTIDRPALLPGETFCDPTAKVAVTLMSADASGALLHVDFGRCQ